MCGLIVCCTIVELEHVTSRNGNWKWEHSPSGNGNTSSWLSSPLNNAITKEQPCCIRHIHSIYTCSKHMNKIHRHM